MRYPRKSGGLTFLWFLFADWLLHYDLYHDGILSLYRSILAPTNPLLQDTSLCKQSCEPGFSMIEKGPLRGLFL